MTDRSTPPIDRRTALRLFGGSAVAGLAGCLGGDGTTPTDATVSAGPLDRVAVEGTTLVVELAADASADVDRVNLIGPDGELANQREVATGVERVSFDLGTSYAPGEHRVIALADEESVAERELAIVPDLRIREVGLYRNNPDKPWDEVYGESKTNTIKNGEAYVTVENTGTGPEAAVGLGFIGDVPNPTETPPENGIYGSDEVLIEPGDRVDLFSESLPFGAKISEEGMGCSPEGNSGEFTVTVQTEVSEQASMRTFAVEYAGSEEMHDCEITIGGS